MESWSLVLHARPLATIAAFVASAAAPPWDALSGALRRLWSLVVLPMLRRVFWAALQRAFPLITKLADVEVQVCSGLWRAAAGVLRSIRAVLARMAGEEKRTGTGTQ